MLGRDTLRSDLLCDILHADAGEVAVKDLPDDNGLVLDDLQLVIDQPVAVGGAAGREDAALHPHLIAVTHSL